MDAKNRYKTIISLTLPILMTTIVSNLGVFLDTIFVSRANGEFLSAIGIVNQPILIIYSIFSAWNIGVAALISKAKHEFEYDNKTSSIGCEMQYNIQIDRKSLNE